MIDHLKEAKFFAHAADELSVSLSETGRRNAQLAIAHGIIAIAERLPRPTETWSECAARLRQEEKDNGI